MPTLRLVFHLALRQAEAFNLIVLALLGLDVAVPDHTTLSRRSRAFAGWQHGAVRHDGSRGRAPRCAASGAKALRSQGSFRVFLATPERLPGHFNQPLTPSPQQKTQPQVSGLRGSQSEFKSSWWLEHDDTVARSRGKRHRVLFRREMQATA